MQIRYIEEGLQELLKDEHRKSERKINKLESAAQTLRNDVGALEVHSLRSLSDDVRRNN